VITACDANASCVAPESCLVTGSYQGTLTNNTTFPATEGAPQLSILY